MMREQVTTSKNPTSEFFELVGRCITTWAWIDDELFRIFHCCVGPREQCAIIFYRLPGLDARLSLTDEIVRSILPKKAPGEHGHESIKEWSRILKQIRSLLTTRRRIAHHPVAFQSEPPFQFGITPFGAGVFGDKLPEPTLTIRVGEHEKLRPRESDEGGLTKEELVAHLQSVRSFANSLNSFSRNLLQPVLEERQSPIY
ncbi:hypothetical protein GGD83_001188 [Rhodoblastus sphagnicola]|uniref:hypothetical protein n=1 Tax=Rhodoblastus sphagnicola TaxID=333368 RepID=UPI0011AFE5E6|nr:hypothetical protein [Rhodoblastus sphagnicola]MBB4197402.1 hypothetical protein [Rhodoblastus sphagnicola]